MPLRKIIQTSKTLLIEEFNTSDTSPDLCTILKNESDENKSILFKIIQDNLEVKSFKEFTQKFMPSVWEWMETSQDPSVPFVIRYSLEQPRNMPNAHELKLSDNEFYQMVMDLYSKKGSSGESNLTFDYSKVAELLTPGKVMDKAKQLRKGLVYNYEKMLKLDEGNKVELNECKRNIVNIRKTIVDQYRDSITGVLKLALADTEQKLNELTPSIQSDNQLTYNDVKALPCRVSFDDNGNILVNKIENDSDDVVLLESGENSQGTNQIAKWVGNDFDKECNSGDFIKNLVVSNYCASSNSIVQIDRAELCEKRNLYTDIYKQAQENFIRAISTAVEKMLDVKVFFDQASESGRDLPSSVIVTNCKASKLVEDEEVKEKFKYYITECEKDINNFRIWFAIIPSVGDSDFIENIKDEEIDLDNLDFSDDLDSGEITTADGDKLISLDTLKQTLEILKEGKVTTFFNFRANEKTGFEMFNNKIINLYKSKTSKIDSSYAVFCYPNFTILPKRKTAIEIGKKGDGIDPKSDKKVFLDIPGIYVDSSYVAAGIVVASQNPKYLKKKGFEVIPDNPCVRFDLEEDCNRFVMLTEMNREGLVDWASNVEEEIFGENYGFCFCGNNKYYEGKPINKTYVCRARNLRKNKNGRYEKICFNLTKDFVLQYLKTANNTNGLKIIMDSDKINHFVDEEVADWKNKAQSESENNYANLILKEKEDIIFENGKFKINFIGDDNECEIDVEISE